MFQIEISYEFTEIKIYMQFNFKNNMTELEAMNGFQPETWKVTKTKKSTKILRNVKVCAANNVNTSKAMKGPWWKIKKAKKIAEVGKIIEEISQGH